MFVGLINVKVTSDFEKEQYINLRHYFIFSTLFENKTSR